jgi:hypothetical protein
MIKLPDWRDPIVFALLVALAIVIALNIFQRIQIAGVRQELSVVSAARDAALRDTGALKVQRDDAVAVNANMARRLDEQSRQVASLQAAGQAREQKAASAARVVLAERPRLPAGHGPAAMNAWLQDVFR